MMMQEETADSNVKFQAGMTLDQYLTQLHSKPAQNQNDQQESDSDIQAEALDRFEIRETDQDKYEEDGEGTRVKRVDSKDPVRDYGHTDRLPYSFNMRMSQLPYDRPIHELIPRKPRDFRVSKKVQSHSPQKKPLDLFRSLYGNSQFPERPKPANLHGTLYSKSIFPRIDQRKPVSLNKHRDSQFEVLISTKQLLRLKGLPTQGPLEMRVDGIKDKYFQRKSKSKNIKIH